MNNNQDLIVQFAVLWGIETADSRNNEKRYELLRSLDSEELYSIFQGWLNEYLKSDIEDSVDFFNNKLENFLKDDNSLINKIQSAEDMKNSLRVDTSEREQRNQQSR